jgi:hypothetical protein
LRAIAAGKNISVQAALVARFPVRVKRLPLYIHDKAVNQQGSVSGLAKNVDVPAVGQRLKRTSLGFGRRVDRHGGQAHAGWAQQIGERQHAQSGPTFVVVADFRPDIKHPIRFSNFLLMHFFLF